MVKNTTCSTSFLAAASKKLVGTVCSSTPESVVGLLARAWPASAEPESMTPAPGFTRLTAASPMKSATVVTISKYTNDFSARRPTRLRSSPWPAMPTTRLAMMSGTTIDLIIRRKIDESGLSAAPTSTVVHTVLSR